MDFLQSLPSILDPYCIAMYRITGNAVVNYCIGTFLLAFITVVLGEFTLSLVMRINHRHIQRMEDEMAQQHQLSLAALHMADKKSYQACNQQANDVLGRYFFNMVAYSAAYLWPIPFALTWMQSRFIGVEFIPAYPLNLIWHSTGYFTTFILFYILGRILFKNIRRYLPYFKEVQKTLDLYSKRAEFDEKAPAPVSVSGQD